jgi:hypothetical protein
MSDEIQQYDDDYLNSLTQEQIDAMIASGEIPAESELLQEQLAQAKALRNKAMPEGRQAGRVFVAASPLEALATGISNVKGQQGIEAAQAGQKALVGKDSAGARAMLSGMLGASAIRKKRRKMVESVPTPGEIQAPQMVEDDLSPEYPVAPRMVE